jgi:hypothetical protein
MRNRNGNEKSQFKELGIAQKERKKNFSFFLPRSVFLFTRKKSEKKKLTKKNEM